MKYIFKSLYLFLFSIFIVTLFTSCSSKYLVAKTKYARNMALDNNNSAFAFIASNKLYRMPTGIAKFPDGGKSITEYHDISLYYYDIKNKKLNRAVNLNELKALYPKDIGFNQTKLAFYSPLIYYKIPTATNYDIEVAKGYNP